MIRRNRIHIRPAAPPTTPAIYKYVTVNPASPPIQPSLPLPQGVDISTNDSTELLEQDLPQGVDRSTNDNTELLEQDEFRDDAAGNMGGVTEHITPSPKQTMPIQRPIRERKRPRRYDDFVLYGSK